MFFLKIKFSLAVIRFLPESDTTTPFMLNAKSWVVSSILLVLWFTCLRWHLLLWSYESLLSMLIATLKTACTDSSASVDFAFSMLSTELYASNFISAIAVFLRT